MGLVVVPGRFVAPADDVGRLVNTMLGVALAGSIDRQRLQRARQLHADGAVLRVELEPGVMTARVQGSKSEPYSVRIEAATTPPPPLVDGRLQRGTASSLVPDIGSLHATCTCPGWDAPCKHSVAALLALGAELQMRPALLLEWRCANGQDVPDESVSNGGRSSTSPGGPSSRPALRLAPDSGAAGREGGGARSRRDVIGDSAPIDVSELGSGVDDPAATALGDHRAANSQRRASPREHAAMAHPDWPDFIGSLPIAPGPEVPGSLSLEGRQALGAIDLTAWLAAAHAAMRSAFDDR
ncbi:MAG: hypothetical protein RLY45_2421 [Actinomycetota bacterium]